MFIRRGQTVFLADTSVAENPDGRALADIAVQTAATARSLGFEPRVALLSYSNFGQPARPTTRDVRDAVQELEHRGVDFEFDGEMQVNVALDYELSADGLLSGGGAGDGENAGGGGGIRAGAAPPLSRT